jgi:hypothetical protein
MKMPHPLFSIVLPVLLVLSLPGCNTTGVPSDFPAVDVTAEVYFVSRPLPGLSIPADVGARTENPADETGIINDAFREAYVEGLLREIPLMGVLGSDRVNPWPAAAPECFSQNWVSAEGEPNSWGIPNLVLALGNYHDLAGGESGHYSVFTVSGQILDLYGKSAGYHGNNGAAGYGIPLGEVFFSDGMAVQRFSRGRMITDGKEGRFSFLPDTFTSLLESLSPEEKQREFSGSNIPPDVSSAFARAWAYTFSEREGNSDGPVTRVSFSRPWILHGETKEIPVKGFYYKSYNRENDVLVLLDAEELPLRARLLSGTYLQIIRSHKRLPGLSGHILGSAAGTGLGRSLTEGFAIYGPPLSDPLPIPAHTMPAHDEEAVPETFFLEAQRFARGWIVVKAPQMEAETEPET